MLIAEGGGSYKPIKKTESAVKPAEAKPVNDKPDELATTPKGTVKTSASTADSKSSKKIADIPTDTYKAYSQKVGAKSTSGTQAYGKDSGAKLDVPISGSKAADKAMAAGPSVIVLDDFEDHDQHGKEVADELKQSGVDKGKLVGYQASSTKGDVPAGTVLPKDATTAEKTAYYKKRAEELSVYQLKSQAKDVKQIADKAKPGSVINDSIGFSKTSLAENILKEQGITDPKDAQAVYDAVSATVDTSGKVKAAKTAYDTSVSDAKKKGVSVVSSAGNDQEKITKGTLNGADGKPIQGKDGKPAQLTLTPDGAVNQFSTAKDAISVGSLNEGADGKAGTGDDTVASYSAGDGKNRPDVLAAPKDGRVGTSFATGPVVASLLGQQGTEEQLKTSLSKDAASGIVAANNQKRDAATGLFSSTADANGTAVYREYDEASGTPVDSADNDEPPAEFLKGMSKKGYDAWRNASAEYSQGDDAKALLLGKDSKDKVAKSTGNYLAAAIRDAQKNQDKGGNDLVHVEKDSKGNLKYTLTKQAGILPWNIGEAGTRLQEASDAKGKGDSKAEAKAFTQAQTQVDGTTISKKIKAIGQPDKDGNYDITAMLPEDMKTVGTSSPLDSTTIDSFGDTASVADGAKQVTIAADAGDGTVDMTKAKDTATVTVKPSSDARTVTIKSGESKTIKLDGSGWSTKDGVTFQNGNDTVKMEGKPIVQDSEGKPITAADDTPVTAAEQTAQDATVSTLDTLIAGAGKNGNNADKLNGISITDPALQKIRGEITKDENIKALSALDDEHTSKLSKAELQDIQSRIKQGFTLEQLIAIGKDTIKTKSSAPDVVKGKTSGDSSTISALGSYGSDLVTAADKDVTKATLDVKGSNNTYYVAKQGLQEITLKSVGKNFNLYTASPTDGPKDQTGVWHIDDVANADADTQYFTDNLGNKVVVPKGIKVLDAKGEPVN